VRIPGNAIITSHKAAIRVKDPPSPKDLSPGHARFDLSDFKASFAISWSPRMTSISYLADHPEYISVLAPEITAHWRPMIPEETLEGRVAKLRSHMNYESLPIAWVAHSAGEVFGTAALREHDLEGREDLTPWLAGVFVRSPFRGKGIASLLCRAAEEKAWALGFDRLFLFTLDHQSLYFTLGWSNCEKALWRGHESAIMTKCPGWVPRVP
jgi:GNAT superfamily N-acetyltransferase